MGSHDDVKIDDVSDTALWVAVYRAQESERPDALFRDPLAAVLAGERGRKIAESMAGRKIMAWALAMRTSAIDRLVLRAIELGAEVVVNLGAGLDTRPYRMTGLPAALRWIEVDFPKMIELKNSKLANEKPVCRLERIPLDLSDRGARTDLLARISANARCVAVITEGVIPYLEAPQVRSLGEDLFKESKIRFWIQDYSEAGFTRGLRRGWARKLKAAPFKFKVKDWFEFFAATGWKKRELVPTIAESERVGRRPPLVFPWSIFWILGYVLTTPKGRLKKRSAVGYVLLERA